MAATSFKPGNTVYWTETGNTIRSGVIIRRTGNRYIIRAGYEGGVCLPAARLYATYEDAAATLPPPEGHHSGKGRWRWDLE